MKKIFLLAMFLGIGYLGYLFFTTGPDYVEEDLVIEDAFQPEEEVPTYETFDLDEEEEVTEKPKRMGVEREEVEASFEDRERTFIGPDFRPLTHVPNNIKFENAISPNWEKNLIKEFLEDEETEANLEVQKLDSLVFVKDEIGMYVEKVKILVTEPKDMAGSFYAYVDSATGEIFHAWEENEDPGSGMFGGMDDEEFDEEGHFIETVDGDFEEGIEYTEEDMYEMGPEEISYAPGSEEEHEEYY